MGIRELGFPLIMFMYLLHSVSPSPVQQSLSSPSELMHNSMVEEKRHVHVIKREGGSVIHGATGGGGGGMRAPNNGENGNTQQGGGAAVIPIYTAASTNNQKNHHNAATCSLKTIEFPTLIIIIMTVFILVQF